MDMHTGASWRIRLNDPGAASMRTCAKSLGPLVDTFNSAQLFSVRAAQPQRSRIQQLRMLSFNSACVSMLSRWLMAVSASGGDE